jgi:methionyl-tRNA formyltransferase
MKSYILVSEKNWHDELFLNLKNSIPANWTRIKSRDEFEYLNLEKLNPDKIFIPHWSYIIPKDIFEKFECIVFHMTDLPFGRGGSPLQNLIHLGFEQTKISALKVSSEIDAGPIYCKNDLSLLGTAAEIFIRSSYIVGDMIREIIDENLEPKGQEGEVVVFKRRKLEDGDISKLFDLTKVYDYIRMLDAETYPLAFLETEFFRFEFTRASLKSNEIILADVRIIKK